MRNEWRGFKGQHWTDEVNMRDFIQNNYTSYDGDEAFLAGPTEATEQVVGYAEGTPEGGDVTKGGVLDMETEVVSSITAYPASYMGEGTKELEKVGG